MNTPHHVTPTAAAPVMTIQDRAGPVPRPTPWRRWFAALAATFSAGRRAKQIPESPYLVQPLRWHRERKK